MKRKVQTMVVEELRELATAFRKNDRDTAKAIQLVANNAENADLTATRRMFKKLDIHVQAAILDLCPHAYDWIRFGIAWPDSSTTFRETEIATAKKFLKTHGGDRHVAYNAALQKLIRTKKEEYATIAAWCRAK